VRTVPIQLLNESFDLNAETGVITWKAGNRAGFRAGYKDGQGYRSIKIDGHLIGEHRIVFAMIHNRWPDGEVDHVNCVRDDNRPENLREATHSQNHMNKRKPANNKLGAKGVARNGSGYRAQIRVNGKQVALGTYRTIEEAAEAYARAANENFGEFGRAA